MKVIYFGTPLISAHVLEFLLANGIEVVAVISKPDKPKGRSGTPLPTPVKIVAQQFNIPVFQPEKVSDPLFAPILQEFHADLFVVVAYGEIIKQHLLEMPKLGCINLHVSLLPKYRGAAPIQRAIIEGETITGVSIIHMVKKMDAGNVIETASTPIPLDMTFGELETHLEELGKTTLLNVINKFQTAIPPSIPQDESKVTFAPKIELEDCQIHWEQPSKKIHNLVRGVNPYPVAWCSVSLRGENKRLKVYKTKIRPDLKGKPGTILSSSKENLIIATGDSSLELLDIQLEGKKMMPSKAFIQGIVLESLSFL